MKMIKTEKPPQYSAPKFLQSFSANVRYLKWVYFYLFIYVFIFLMTCLKCLMQFWPLKDLTVAPGSYLSNMRSNMRTCLGICKTDSIEYYYMHYDTVYT